MNNTKSNEAEIPGPLETHHLDVPDYGRFTCTLEKTPLALMLAITIPSTPPPCPSLLLHLEKWMLGLMESDPRPLGVSVYLGSTLLFRGSADASGLAYLFGGLAS
jgi:hypothetical protein